MTSWDRVMGSQGPRHQLRHRRPLRQREQRRRAVDLLRRVQPRRRPLRPHRRQPRPSRQRQQAVDLGQPLRSRHPLPLSHNRPRSPPHPPSNARSSVCSPTNCPRTPRRRKSSPPSRAWSAASARHPTVTRLFESTTPSPGNCCRTPTRCWHRARKCRSDVRCSAHSS